MQKEHEMAMDKLKQELRRIHDLFANLKELFWIEKLLQAMRFSENLIKEILKIKSVGFRGKIYSSEYKQYFETGHSVAEIKPNPKDQNKLQLTIDGVSPTNWFRLKYREFQETIGIKVKPKSEINKSKGFKVSIRLSINYFITLWEYSN